MHPFEQTLSVIGPIVLAIMVLTIFFKAVAWVTRSSSADTTRIKFRGILDDKTRATVHLSTGTSFEDVRFIGFTDPGSIKGHFPFELQGMVILELPDGRRVMIQAKLIRMIEVPPQKS
jgi:hypothetical protein